MSTSTSFSCQFCDKGFKTKNNCKRHIKNVHKRNSAGDLLPDFRRDKFTCVLCDKSYAEKRNLDHHINVTHFLFRVTRSKNFKCTSCSFETAYKKNLKRHVSRKHNENNKIPQSSFSRKFKCFQCTASFTHEKNLKYHKRKFHNIGGVDFQIKRKCPLCPYTSTQRSKVDIHKHFEKNHDLPIRSMQYRFNSIEEFNIWKSEMEKATTASYVKRFSNETLAYYQCHRCGYHTSRGHTKRRLKLSGSCKINGYCPAHLTMKIKNNEVYVLHVTTHVGHKNEVKHIRLFREERRSIALQLANKKPHEEILKAIRGSISNIDLKRIHLTNKKDIINIENSFNLHIEAIKHPFDPVSIAAWVKELTNSENVSLIKYKAQGEESVEYPNLKKDDFLLIFMTETQKAMLKTHGQETICIDGTHGLNSYDFQLFTLLTLDETREGFPVAFMFTNRADKEVMNILYEGIKSEVGPIQPNIFMSDMDETFFSTWKEVMGPVQHRLFCTWHVLKAWRKKLIQEIKLKEKREYVHRLLQTLVYELDIEKFKQILPTTLTIMKNDEDLKNFVHYFEKHYVINDRYKCWAYCYRLHVGINTNMSIENFNKVLKYCYLRGKTLCRLDKTLCAILNLLRDKMFDLIIKMNRVKLVRKLQMLRKNHRKSLTIPSEKVINIEERKWQVCSLDESELYTIKRIRTCKTCQLVCLHCESCFHEFVCTCVDNSIKNNMCKHIHAVACTLRQVSPQEQHNYSEDNSVSTNGYGSDCDFNKAQDQYDILKELSKPVDSNSSLENVKSKITEEIGTITTRITNLEQGNYVLQELKRISTTVDAMNMTTTHTSTLKVKHAVSPANTIIVHQRKFASTKKLHSKSRKSNQKKLSSKKGNEIAFNLPN